MKRLRFRPITAESLDELRQYSARCDSRVSDYSLANLYGWQPYFNTCYATHDGIVAIRYTSPQGIGYMRPLTSARCSAANSSAPPAIATRLIISGTFQPCQSARL